jgi:XRE family aerobic/anaerobic benzoate catabolism transcriptional regulator
LSLYLQQLAGRVREARARRGMTRKILARDSGVSERYLAQLEAGKGNITISLLRRVAAAMGLPLAALLSEEPERPAELALLRQMIGRLSPQELSEARQLLGQRFGLALDGGRRERIALIGLRGAGKSTLGGLLAQKLGVPFVELDREVEHELGAPLAEIFDLYGQAAFRRAERRALETVIAKRERAVIATSGSIVSEPGTFDLLLSTCFTVWLKARPEEHMSRVFAQGDTRPMQASREAMADLRRILEGRNALYAKADITVDTGARTVETTLADLFSAVTASRRTA